MGATFRQALAATATLCRWRSRSRTLERWLARRKPHEVAWTGRRCSCSPPARWRSVARRGLRLDGDWSFRVFYLFGAVLNVPFLALGTVYLLGRRRARPTVAVGRRAGRRVRRRRDRRRAAHGTGRRPTCCRRARTVFGALPRVLAGVGSGVAAMVIIGGALWSAVAPALGGARAPTATAGAGRRQRAHRRSARS